MHDPTTKVNLENPQAQVDPQLGTTAPINATPSAQPDKSGEGDGQGDGDQATSQV